MGIFFDTFKEQVKEIWDIAHKLDKPIHKDISWTMGLIKGRGDFLDLQLHGIALASSIIIKEKIVPKIICGWDTNRDIETTKWDDAGRLEIYPIHFFSMFSDDPAKYAEKANIYKCGHFSTKYISLYHSNLSLSSFAYSLGLGYRAKYIGLNYVTTPYAIMSDIDTICIRECVDYLMSEVQKDPETFCLTNWYDENILSVGLLVLNMNKYRNIYMPHFRRMYWELGRQDSLFVQSVRNKFPELKDQLDIRLFNKNMINAERFKKSKRRKNNYTDSLTAHYHAWKGEIAADQKGFLKFYGGILSSLKISAEEQL